ncbi:uncharacterized protein V1513DRAFT_414020 [Lipomyces chichibuensis]|uniref:uncharacterized protein n=1 Tax=Lipomyces chichibuensis TaxID=1546026 RepID=UPI0033431288
MTVDTEFDIQSDAFMDWLRAQSGVRIASKISLHDLRAQQQGRGVVASADIHEGELLFSFPRSVVLSIENSGITEKIPEILELDHWIGMIVTMMAENKPDSRWKPYFDILPKKFTTPMFWSKSDLEELSGTTVLAQLGKDDAEATYRDVVLPIVKKYPDVFGKIDTSIDAYHRMGSLILSYSFDIEREGRSDENEWDGNGNDEEKLVEELPTVEESDSDYESAEVENEDENDTLNENDEDRIEVEEEEDNDDDQKFLKAMVPLADMLNGDSDLCNAKLFYSKENLEMRATKFIPEGSQIYNTYGDLPNADLLRRYGYVRFGKTKNDVVEVETQLVIDSSPHRLSETLLKKRIDFMIEVDQEEDEELLDDYIQISISSSAIPTSALLLTYILMLNPTAFRSLRKQGHDAVQSITRKELKSEEQRELWTTIIKKKLAQYKTDIVTDENLILETPPDHNLNLRNAIEVRLSEKRILEAAMKKVREWKIKDKKRRKEFSTRPSKRSRS